MVDVISTPQRRKIYAMAWQLKWTNAQLHLFLAGQTGKEHISTLTRNEARRFIDDLVKMTGEKPNQGYRADRENDRILKNEGLIMGATPAQCDKIHYLAEDAGWTETRLLEYIERYGARQLEHLTRTLAQEVIEHLKAVVRYQEQQHVLFNG